MRALILARAQGLCELCGLADAVNVHHIRYPKAYPNDHPDNLLALCRECHRKQHGIRTMPSIDTYKEMELPALNGEDVSVLVVGDRVYLHPVTALDGMRVPPGKIHAWMLSRLPAWADGMTVSWDSGGEWRAEIKGQTVYRLQVYLKGFEWYERGNLDLIEMISRRQPPPIGKKEDYEFLRRLEVIKQWVWSTAEKALRGEMERARPGGKPINQLRAMFKVIDDHQHSIDDHEQRLLSVESKGGDPDEFITARDGCVELGKDPGRLVRGRINLETEVGNKLSDEQKGPERRQRLSGASVIVTVNTYQRAAVHAVVSEF